MCSEKFLMCEEERVPIVVPKRLMVIAPHPDDEIVSCGGTLLKYQELGSEIIIVIATSGLGGYAKEENKAQIREKRKSESEKVAEILDCTLIELGYGDMKVTRRKISRLTNLIRDNRPQVILMPHFSDFHRVHRNLSLIVREAIYHCATGKAYGGHQRNWTPFGVYYYESPSCKFQYIEESVFVVVDIDAYWERKKEIFSQIYISQKIVLDRVVDWAKDTAFLRGNEINAEYGEAFIPETTYTPLKILLS
ncbi:MAG: PIG-L deacetylase family protein [Promethearchaeia archaeon]